LVALCMLGCCVHAHIARTPARTHACTYKVACTRPPVRMHAPAWLPACLLGVCVRTVGVRMHAARTQARTHALCGPASSSPPSRPPQRGLVGEIIKRFEQKGFTLRGLKMISVDRALAEAHYAGKCGGGGGGSALAAAAAANGRAPATHACMRPAPHASSGLPVSSAFRQSLARGRVHCTCDASIQHPANAPCPADLSKKPFFGALVDYICSGPVVAMVGVRHALRCPSRIGWRLCTGPCGRTADAHNAQGFVAHEFNRTGVGGPQRGQHWPQDHRCHQPRRLGAWYHPRRLCYRDVGGLACCAHSPEPCPAPAVSAVSPEVAMMHLHANAPLAPHPPPQWPQHHPRQRRAGERRQGDWALVRAPMRLCVRKKPCKC